MFANPVNILQSAARRRSARTSDRHAENPDSNCSNQGFQSHIWLNRLRLTSGRFAICSSCPNGIGALCQCRHWLKPCVPSISFRRRLIAVENSACIFPKNRVQYNGRKKRTVCKDTDTILNGIIELRKCQEISANFSYFSEVLLLRAYILKGSDPYRNASERKE